MTNLPSGKSEPLWSAFELTEGFFLAQATLSLEQLGILNSINEPLTIRQIARRHNVDKEIIGGVLEILAARTTLIRYSRGAYKTTRNYTLGARFDLLQYVAAYGGNVRALPRILRYPSTACRFVDRKQHKRAFEQRDNWADDPLARIVTQRGLNRLLDIGCGTGGFLLYLASQRKDFIGWGVDKNPLMCSEARKGIARARKRSEIKIFTGDSMHLRSLPIARIADDIQAITATGVANEFFFDGDSAVKWLMNIKSLFPGRIMLIEDYYGQLGFRRKRLSRGVALHDFIQLISGQGIPPPHLSGWKRIYREAQCRFIETIQNAGGCNFVHILYL